MLLAAPLVLSACSAGMGWAVEVNAGLARLDANGADRGDRTVTAGLGLALEFDWLRDADLGLGLGWQTVGDGGATDDPGAGISARPLRVWLASAIGNSGWTVRPRATMGASLANGDGDLYAEGYAGLGVSVHPTRGTALHVLVGPQVVRATDALALGPSVTYQGWGVQARVRLFRMFWRRCDPASRADAAALVRTRSESSCM
ncbi:MAG: hypothetical protein H6708_21745 [Kofleriaceae bacterium]|nr:hypothetical protein [Myxococcales bacterium]MCB9563038.1 hypothetical protein [Kofleriaceae bacterium]